MKAPALERTSAAKAGWLIIALTLGWLVFLFLPDPAQEQPAKPAAVPIPTTSLTKAGLREYTDWEGLPEIFAIWADKAEWKDNRTKFAYWHPVMKSYSYYFEAVRTGGGYRFQEIAKPHDPDYFWDESLGDDCPIRFYIRPGKDSMIRSMPSPVSPAVENVKPQVDAVPVTIPTTDLKPAPLPPAPRF